MARLATLIHRVATLLDETGKAGVPIRATVTRQTLMRIGIRPERRGGPLKVGGHEVTYRQKEAP